MVLERWDQEGQKSSVQIFQEFVSALHPRASPQQDYDRWAQAPYLARLTSHPYRKIFIQEALALCPSVEARYRTKSSKYAVSEHGFQVRFDPNEHADLQLSGPAILAGFVEPEFAFEIVDYYTEVVAKHGIAEEPQGPRKVREEYFLDIEGIDQMPSQGLTLVEFLGDYPSFPQIERAPDFVKVRFSKGQTFPNIHISNPISEVYYVSDRLRERYGGK